MKVQFDEDLHYRFAPLIHSGSDVHSAQCMEWSGLSRGELLRASEANSFDVLIAADRTMRHQQPQCLLAMPEVGITALRYQQKCGSPVFRRYRIALTRSPFRGSAGL